MVAALEDWAAAAEEAADLERRAAAEAAAAEADRSEEELLNALRQKVGGLVSLRLGVARAAWLWCDPVLGRGPCCLVVVWPRAWAWPFVLGSGVDTF